MSFDADVEVFDTGDVFDDADLAYEASVDPSSGWLFDGDPNFRADGDFMHDGDYMKVWGEPQIPGVPENHVPGQMNVYDFLGHSVEYDEVDVPF